MEFAKHTDVGERMKGGEYVGVPVGDAVGPVGNADGRYVGDVGALVGDAVGTDVGALVGAVGTGVGALHVDDVDTIMISR